MNLLTWKKYIHLFRRSFRKLGLMVIISAGQSLIYLLIAYLVRYSFDQIISNGERNRLIVVGGILILIIGINIGITLWARYLTRRITTQVICDLRNELLTKFISLPRSYYTRADLSRLHTSIIQDTQRLDIMNNSIVTKALPSIVILIGLTGALVYLNWALFAVMIITILPLFIVSRLAKNRIQEQVSIYHRSLEKLSKGMLFILQTMDLILNQTAGQYELERQRNRHDEMRLRSFFLVWADAIYGSVTSGIVALSGIIILVVGGMAVGSKMMTLGELLSFYVVIAFMRSNLNAVMYSIPLIFEGDVSLTSLYNILNTKDSQPYHGQRKISFKGKITFEAVDFRYTDEQILHDVNLVIQPGTMVVLMGPNGVGKSTVAHLISGFYRPQGGYLFADGHPYDDLDIEYLRKYIGVVQQEPVIFSGTIWENITYGLSNASATEVEQACRLTTAYEFIQELPKGFNTRTGEGGVRLSGGQRQSIAIARALLRHPKLLILDEPTNHLDEVVMRQLMHNLKELESAPAILIITHVMEVARHAQLIYVMKSRGQISAIEDPTMFLQEMAMLAT